MTNATSHRNRCDTPGGPRSATVLQAAGHIAFSQTRPIVRNRFSGPCVLCGHPVAPGEGGVEKDRQNGAWKVYH